MADHNRGCQNYCDIKLYEDINILRKKEAPSVCYKLTAGLIVVGKSGGLLGGLACEVDTAPSGMGLGAVFLVAEQATLVQPGMRNLREIGLVIPFPA